MTIKEVEWKDFYISGDNGIFELRASKSGIDKNKLTICEEQNIPYITRSDLNNGISDFVGENQKSPFELEDGNVITIGLDTQTVFYQPYKFHTGQNIQILKNEHINRYTGLFISHMLKIQLSKFFWGGNGATLGRLKRTKIMLPVNQAGEPNYQFMENYMKEKEKKLFDKYLSCKKMRGGVEISLNMLKWKQFKIKDIFNLNTGKLLPKNVNEGKYPRITASDSDNGIASFKENFAPNLLISNFISVSFLGSVFYQKYNSTLDMKIHGLQLKNASLNENLALFLSVCIKRTVSKFSYGDQCSSTDLPEQLILLPVDNNDIPNYEIMERYATELKRTLFNKTINVMKALIYRKTN